VSEGKKEVDKEYRYKYTQCIARLVDFTRESDRHSYGMLSSPLLYMSHQSAVPSRHQQDETSQSTINPQLNNRVKQWRIGVSP
jgi:hypothetical protein